MRKLDEIRQAGATTHEVTLAPLNCDDLTLFVADALRCPVRGGLPAGTADLRQKRLEIPFLPFSSFLVWRTKPCLPSITSKGDGSGTLAIFVPKAIRITLLS